MQVCQSLCGWEILVSDHENNFPCKLRGLSGFYQNIEQKHKAEARSEAFSRNWECTHLPRNFLLRRREPEPFQCLSTSSRSCLRTVATWDVLAEIGGLWFPGKPCKLPRSLERGSRKKPKNPTICHSNTTREVKIQTFKVLTLKKEKRKKESWFHLSVLDLNRDRKSVV